MNNIKVYFVVLFVVSIISIVIGAGLYWLLNKNDEDIQSPETVENASCSYNNLTYQHGDTFDATDSCNKCFCNNGTVTCTHISCSASETEEETLDDSDTSQIDTEVSYLGTAEDLTKVNGVYTLTFKTGSWESCEYLGYNKCPHDYYWDDSNAQTHTFEISKKAEIITHSYFILTPDLVGLLKGFGECTSHDYSAVISSKQFETVWKTCISKAEPDPSTVRITVLDKKIIKIVETK